jgi:signal transduction histidine kinase
MSAPQPTSAFDYREALSLIPTFADLPAPELDWLLRHAGIWELEADDYLFRKGEPADHMWVFLEGKVQILIEQNGQQIPINMLTPGSITGLLPFSQLKVAAGVGIALQHTVVLGMHRRHFREMERECPELVRRLVTVMTSRIREFTKAQEQRDKLLSLSKLSAGLAHEFNNPVAAIARTTAELKKRVDRLPEQMHELVKRQITPRQIEAITAMLEEKAAVTPPSFSSLAQSDLEEALAAWMDDRQVEDSYILAESFVRGGFGVEDLEALAAQVPPSALPPLLVWIESTLIMARLVAEIEAASGRISDLVESVKIYTHMDQAADKQPVNPHGGIQSTLTVMGYKLGEKHVRVETEFMADPPLLLAHPSELNQVWTNLIDNAVDAMPDGGTLRIKTEQAGHFFLVRIIDNGTGIPAEILPKIYDPFFTTKPVGKGTGLGLDVVNRLLQNHQAVISAKSEPGRTEFTVCFPLGE